MIRVIQKVDHRFKTYVCVSASHEFGERQQTEGGSMSNGSATSAF